MCGQIIEHLQSLNIPEKNILYLNVENNNIITNTDGIIDESLQVYETYVLEQSFRSIEMPIFVFIDEIQKANHWADVVKYYTDTYSNILFVCTGSISTLIQDDASDTLVGRLEERIMMPMKFVDVIGYHGLLGENTLKDESTSLRNALDTAVKNGDRSDLTRELTRFYGTHNDIEPQILSHESDYLLKGGYPGVLDSSYTDAYSELDSDLTYTVLGDLSNVFGVKKEEKVLKVLRLVADSTTGKINVQSMAEAAGIDRDTVERYLKYLEEFFLISRSEQYTTSEYRSSGREKVYIQDVGLYNTLQGTLAEATLQDNQKMGPVLETAIADHTRRIQFYLSGHQNANVAYWDKVKEVDFVVTGPDYVLPIEVKSGDSTTADLGGLKAFVEESSATFGLAVNRSGELKEEGDIIHVPSWLFMLLC